MLWPLTTAILLAGTGDLLAIWLGRRSWRYLFKPGTMLLIIALAATGLPGAGLYGYLVVAGLICSVAGDIFLVLPSNRLLAGMASFTLAHLCYIAAFRPAGPLTPAAGLFTLGLIALGILLFRRLWHGVVEQGGKGMLLPVALYLTVISTMLLRAFLTGEPLLLAGALLFYLSDGILAFSQFIRRSANADLAVMSAYFSAQYLIALSVLQHG